MKNLTFILLIGFVLTVSKVDAQTGVRFGFKAGYSLATQYGITPKDNPYSVNSKFKGGFTGGALLNFPINESFSVQQEFLYVQKGSQQNIAMLEAPISTSTDYQLNYFELPFVFRYSFVKIKNVGIYAQSGFAISILLDGEYDMKGSIDMGGVVAPFGESGNMDGVDEFDYSFLYGAGCDFKLLNQDCFFEYRFTIGWNTLMMPTSEGEAPAPLRNQNYTFSLGVYL